VHCQLESGNQVLSRLGRHSSWIARLLGNP